MKKSRIKRSFLAFVSLASALLLCSCAFWGVPGGEDGVKTAGVSIGSGADAPSAPSHKESAPPESGNETGGEERFFFDRTEISVEAYFPDEFTPGYGLAPVQIDKGAQERTPFLYWKNALNSDAARAAYDAVGKLERELSDEVGLSLPISFEELQTVFEYYYLDHPAYFYGSANYTGKGSREAITSISSPPLYAEDEILRMREEIERSASLILEGIDENASDFEAEEYIFSRLADSVVYDPSAPHPRDLFGALVERRCVCEGFAEAFQYLCMRVGIETISIVGCADPGSGWARHKWNAAKIGGKWYQVDVTWAASAGECKWLYFNENDALRRSHAPDGDLENALPPFDARDASYFSYYGLCFDAPELDTAYLRALRHFCASADGGAVTVMLKANSKKIAAAAKDLFEDPSASRPDALFEIFGREHGARGAVFTGIVEEDVLLFKLYT